MNPDTSALAWIDQQQTAMADLLQTWVAINSFSHNLPGLDAMKQALWPAFAQLGGAIRAVDLPGGVRIDAQGNRQSFTVGQAIHVRTRPSVQPRVLLVIHYDTVYPPDHPFQQVQVVDADTWRGPGVVDAKGGIVVMLTALRALERTGLAQRIGWDVVLNPDEEIGSPGSAGLLAELAQQANAGLVFEPGLISGAMIGTRKGAGSWSLVVRGQSAHAGREYERGRSALRALARLIVQLEQLNDLPGVTVNFGAVQGGGPVNVVPDLAIGRFGTRVESSAHSRQLETQIKALVQQANQQEGIEVTLHRLTTRPPRPMEPSTLKLYQQMQACGQTLGMSLRWQSTGGVSDANTLHAAGLACVDSMGPRGGDLHSPSEYLQVSSLAEKAKLTALWLMQAACGQLELPSLQTKANTS